MINDRNPYWGRSFQVSSRDLAELRRSWADVGRQAWDAATRTGQDIQARTERELEALGRAELRRAEAERAQTASMARAAKTVVRELGRGVGEAVTATVDQARFAGRAQADMAHARRTQQVRAADAGWRLATMPPAPFLRQGNPADPGPGRLYEEFRTGAGPQRRILGPRSSFSREFATAPSVQEHVQQTLDLWRERNGGVDMYANPTRADFGVSEFAKDALAGNQASHVVGTFALAGQRRGDEIDWWAENDMDRTSFYGGRIAKKMGLPVARKQARPGPQGTTEQTILFRTDLLGRPLP